MTKTIVVMGATGQQGGAVIDALLSLRKESKDEIVIRGVTTNTSSDSAKKLKAKGVEVVEGNFQDTSTLLKAFERCWGLFLVTTPFSKGKDIEQEVKDGINCIDAAVATKISFVVFSSVGSANKNTKIPHFETKYKIENYLIDKSNKSNNFNDGYCILRPVFFMENFLTMFAPKNGVLSLPLKENTRLQVISVQDIGRFAAQSLIWPKDYYRKQIDIAGDDLTGSQMADIFSQVSGKQVKYKESSWFVKLMLKMFGNDYKLMFDWFESVGYNADLNENRKYVPKINDFKTWANTHFNGADIGPKSNIKTKVVVSAIAVAAVGAGYYYYSHHYNTGKKF